MFIKTFLSHVLLSNRDRLNHARQAKRPGSSLPDAACGETVTICGFNGGRESESRLRSLGLAVGDEITVLNNSGSFIIAHGYNRLAFGAGLANKILTRTL